MPPARAPRPPLPAPPGRGTTDANGTTHTNGTHANGTHSNGNGTAYAEPVTPASFDSPAVRRLSRQPIDDVIEPVTFEPEAVEELEDEIEAAEEFGYESEAGPMEVEAEEPVVTATPRSRRDARRRAKQERAAAKERARADAEAARVAEADAKARAEAEARARAEAERAAERAAQHEMAAAAEAAKVAATAAKKTAKSSRVARKQAKAEAKAQAKAATRAEKAERSDNGSPEQRQQQPEPHHRLSHRDRRIERQAATLGLKEGETLTFVLDGVSRLRSATLMITRYRVALVTRGAKRKVIGWIPLEEVDSIHTAWRGAPTIYIDASVEHLAFQARSKIALQSAIETLQAEIKEARGTGARRHHPDIVQEWCDRTSEMWDSDVGRLRLWIRRHPIVVLSGLTGLVPVAYFISNGQ